ncbi:transglutaminase-like domain-containing protein [Amycolatopsis sp. CA-230715]|uniref:transglutaminase-like domain-containing protein n=1 Tax=Amycolatopsis sp. CA-230715 TaxID=2745196 RepID=UPI001C02D6FE|nr:transglutaminase family protein [Amycolatopsis sp. CA-230715]QWF78094.1 hypothetical protein HUW46_01489 [Amycolatopsis sp. CA-230715]
MSPLCRLETDLSLQITKPGRVALSVAVSSPAREELTLTGPAATGGEPPVVEFRHGTRVHLLDLAEGALTIGYRAECAPGAAEPEPVSEHDFVLYTRPSRYCQSDRFLAVATAEFGELPDVRSKVDAIVAFAARRLSYVIGSSRSSDGAIDTMLAGAGVCRDYAHVCVALCRALDIPARFVAVYAPGLSPMDFHAVFEAAIDGHWYVFDATHLAPRASMVRIATGRDAADTAFLTTLGAELDLTATSVRAVAEPALPEEESGLVALR